MLRTSLPLLFTLATLIACGSGAGTSAAGASNPGGAGGSGAAGGAGGSGGAGASGGFGGMLACDDVLAAIEAYQAAHPGSEGDFNTKTEAEIAADPATKELRDLCGPAERPVIPRLAWEYGGNNHAWISPESSAYYYCVYIPADPSTEHWSFDTGTQLVTADVGIGCPAANPCDAAAGADKVLSCLGDASNIEILVDTASLNDGNDVGLDLSEAQTDLYLVMPDQTKVFLYHGT